MSSFAEGSIQSKSSSPPPAGTPLPKGESDYSHAWPAYGGGFLPREENPTTSCGCWFDLEDGFFKLRGAGYLTDNVKVTSPPAAFKTVGVTVIDSPGGKPLFDIGSRLKPLREYLSTRPADKEYVVMNRAVPLGGGVYRNIIAVAERNLPIGEDPIFDRTWERYKAGDEEYRNVRMKYLPNLRVAPWLVTSAVDLLGGQRPVIMGKGYLEQKNFSGSNYVEFDVDVGSSSIAKSVGGTVLNYSSGVVLDEAFVVEGKEEDELPERMLTQHEFRHVKISECAKPLRPEDYNEMNETEASAK
mmetsp:Transcript_5123/g.9802  ORF Transcript_5123/g.9802 Transcript_5123/m.9802 type:complete len:300 (+) Transcript_5123:106-1005(+)|eukprot:CAMPEP_0182455532 /NCGR_PEP_ID=MMETSP1319-20130603/1670_1 /TAXON_ID=172717 /ORGANISM="Bolidomonas pacifica, Strain RCC208" /LENGTH=299 /DNA_ID=CAMNT_0024653617 /DNA_START=79 /DNA_END=978 /DNA_ORIENTATION=-